MIIVLFDLYVGHGPLKFWATANGGPSSVCRPSTFGRSGSSPSPPSFTPFRTGVGLSSRSPSPPCCSPTTPTSYRRVRCGWSLKDLSVKLRPSWTKPHWETGFRRLEIWREFWRKFRTTTKEKEKGFVTSSTFTRKCFRGMTSRLLQLQRMSRTKRIRLSCRWSELREFENVLSSLLSLGLQPLSPTTASRSTLERSEETEVSFSLSGNLQTLLILLLQYIINDLCCEILVTKLWLGEILTVWKKTDFL